MGRRGLALLVAAGLAVLGAAGASATLPIGDAFRVSNVGDDDDPTFGGQAPAVAHNPQANEYLIVWFGDGLGTNNEDEIFGQRVSATGAELGGDFRISTTGTDGDADRVANSPAVAYNSQAGEYLVVWRSDALADDAVEVFGQRLSASGAELGSDFRISTTSANGDVENPSPAYNTQANEYLVVWNSDTLVDAEQEVFGQRLSASGAELGGDFQLSNAGAGGDATNPAVAHNPQGNEYLVAWDADELETDNEFEIFGQRLTAGGADLGGDFRISTTGTDGDPTRDAADPSLAYNSEVGEYLVAWEDNGFSAVLETDVFGQRLSPAGAELGGDFRISNAGPDGDVGREAENPSVASNPRASEYLVTWSADALDTDDEVEIFGQRLSAVGAELAGDFRISNAGPDGDAGREALNPAAAYNSQDNEYVVAWESDGLETDDETEIFARRTGAAPLPGTPPVPDTTSPEISGVTLSRKRFRVGRKPTPLAAQRRRRAKAGTTVGYRLSEDATVTFTVERTLPGRIRRVRGKRRCVKPTRKLVRAKAKRCKRQRRAGTLTRESGAGANKLAFSGRVGRRPLRPGRYRFALKATDEADNASLTLHRRFTIVRR